MRKIGVALSGGGYRATAWGLGAILALSDLREAGSNDDRLSTVASVSGGSVTNGFIAAGEPFNSSNSAGFDAEAARLVPRLSGRPGWFWLSLALVLVAAQGVWILDPLLGVTSLAHRLGLTAAVLIVAALLVGRRSGDLLFGHWGIWMYVGVVLVALVGVVSILLRPMAGWSRALAFAAGLVLFDAVPSDAPPWLRQVARRLRGAR